MRGGFFSQIPDNLEMITISSTMYNVDSVHSSIFGVCMCLQGVPVTVDFY